MRFAGVRTCAATLTRGDRGLRPGLRVFASTAHPPIRFGYEIRVNLDKFPPAEDPTVE